MSLLVDFAIQKNGDHLAVLMNYGNLVTSLGCPELGPQQGESW